MPKANTDKQTMSAVDRACGRPCAQCKKPIGVGRQYTERWIGLPLDGRKLPALVLVCWEHVDHKQTQR